MLEKTFAVALILIGIAWVVLVVAVIRWFEF